MNTATIPAGLVRERCHRFTAVAVAAIATMLFTAFTAAILVRRTGPDWRPAPLPGILALTTAVILASSVTLEVARRRGGGRWLGVTATLGLAFLAGQVAAWLQLDAAGVLDRRNVHGAFLVTIAAVHAVHVLGGLSALVLARRNAAAFAAGSVFWHFVGIVWVWIYAMLGAF